MSMTIIGLIIYSLLPFGQLFTRIFDYNGSVHMWWFFLPFFMLPPLQFIPVLMLYLGYIKPGNGTVYDIYVGIPIFIKICTVLFKLFFPDNIYVFWISEVIILISIIIAKYLHTYDACKDKDTKIAVLNSFQFGNILMDAVFENGVAGIFFTVLKFIPGIGFIISVILDSFGSLKAVAEGGLWSFSYIFIYMIQNMFEHVDMNKFCNPTKISPWNIAKFIIGIILFFGSMFLETLTNLKPTKFKPKNFTALLKSDNFKNIKSGYHEAQDRYSEAQDRYSEAQDRYSDMKNVYSNSQDRYSDMKKKMNLLKKK